MRLLSEKGFKRKTYEEILSEMEADARFEYGEDIITDETSPLGKFLRINAKQLEALWEDAEGVYFSSFRNTSRGIQLDRLGPQSGGINREQKRPSNGYVKLKGTPGHTQEAGFPVSTKHEVVFMTTTTVTLDTNGEGLVQIECTKAGAIGNVGANTITVIVNPNPDIQSVTNPEKTKDGRETETDWEFRDRADKTVQGGGSATLDAIRSAVLRVSAVRSATVIENDKEVADSAGRPPKSFQVYVLGGDRKEIAQAIFKNKAGGIQSHGDVTEIVTDLAGTDHTVKFSYAQEVNIGVKLTIRKNLQFPLDGERQVKSALVRYVGGLDYDGSLYTGLGMGDDVIYAKLVASAMKIAGVDDVELTVGKDATKLPQNIAIEPYQVAQLNVNDIEVTVL